MSSAAAAKSINTLPITPPPRNTAITSAAIRKTRFMGSMKASL
jgi:hypothetical protein